jgi:DNA topoisomerase III
MPKTLIVAEKPSVGSDIAKVLGCRDRHKGYVEGEGYIITWAIGHLITLCSPEEMNEALKNWSFDTLPILPEEMKLKVVGRTRDQYGVIKRLMMQNDVSDLICATDSGREGELIFRYIYKVANCDKPFRRLWISSMTDEAIRDGFDRLKPSQEYDNLYQSARCRAEADWLVGMNGSRGYTLQYDRLLSVGRVQSPTLAIMVKREREIQSFVPEKYQELWATFNGFKGRWFDEKDETRPSRIPQDKQEWAAKFAEELKGKPYTVEKIEREQKTFKPPQLYDLTELQRDANRTYGWPAAKTLELAQTLYEKRKLITYPRTDSRYLTRDIHKTLKSRLQKLDVPPWQEFVKIAMESDRNLYGRVINDAHVSDHHAIIPTGKDISKLNLEEDEAKLFSLIAKRFIAIFFPDQEVEYLTVTSRADSQPFLSKGKIVLVPGWSAIYTAEEPEKKKTKAAKGRDEEYVDLPELHEGDTGKVKSAKIEEKQTTPPSRYTEASLLSAMENAGRMIEDEELKEQMKDSGLGTPATRAATIERLIQVRYVRRTGRLLVPTAKGCSLVEVLLSELSSPEMTGRWEKELAQIGRGEKDPQDFMNEIRQFVIKIVGASKSKVEGASFPEEKRASAANATPKEPIGQCPACGSNLYENSKTFYCSRWRAGCKFSIWKDAASKTGGPEIDEALAKKLLEGKPVVGSTGTLQLLKRAPWVDWAPKTEAKPEGQNGKTDEA